MEAIQLNINESDAVRTEAFSLLVKKLRRLAQDGKFAPLSLKLKLFQNEVMSGVLVRAQLPQLLGCTRSLYLYPAENGIEVAVEDDSAGNYRAYERSFDHSELKKACSYILHRIKAWQKRVAAKELAK